MDNGAKDKAAEMVRRLFVGAAQDAWDDSTTTDLVLNPDGRLWVLQFGCDWREIGAMARSNASTIIKTVAGFQNKIVNEQNALLEADFPLDGSRFNAQIFPVTEGPAFQLRKAAVRVFPLSEYVEKGVMREAHARIIEKAVFERKNILVVGGTGTGKTTLLNAIIAKIAELQPTERVALIQDKAEVQCTIANKLPMLANDNHDVRRLLRSALRSAIDRIFVGEVRDAETLDLLDAWNTGHPGGAASLHANNARAAMSRLEMLMSKNPNAPKDLHRPIEEAVQVVVSIVKEKGRRIVREILELQGYANGNYILGPVKEG